MNRKIWLPIVIVTAIVLVGAAYFVGRGTATSASRIHGAATSSTAAPTKAAPSTVAPIAASPSTVAPASALQSTNAPPTSRSSTSNAAEPTVPPAVLAECSRVGGTPVEGQDNWYILGPTYLNPECKDVPYIGPDGMTYYDDFPLTMAGISSTDVYGVSTASLLGGSAATESECSTGNYPEANPGVNTPGTWDSQLGLCLP